MPLSLAELPPRHGAPQPQSIGRWLRPLPHVQLLAGFAIGTGAGTLVGLFAPASAATAIVLRFVVRPIEQIFLQILFLLILPLMFSAIVSGIARLRSQTMVRRLLLTTLAYMVGVSALAALLGLAMANLFRPGDGVAPDIAQQLLAAGRHSAAAAAFPTGLHGLGPTTLFAASPEARFPQLIALALLLGIGLTLVRTRGSRQLLASAEGLFEVGMRLVGIVTRFAPIAVACFMFDLTVVFGWHLLVYLSAYVSVVIAALLIQLLVVFSALVWMVGGVAPLAFLRAVQEAAVIAFCTSSSNATLPSALKVADERLHLPAKVARLVLGAGTVANQGGTAIYAAVTVLFLGQFFGIDLGFRQQSLVFAIAALAGMGTIGVPAGSLPTVAKILALLGLPPEGIGLVIGVDRLLDMFRTVVNVIGDLAITVALSRRMP